MEIGKDDWVFKVNGKNLEMEMGFPNRKSYTSEELTRVTIGLVRMCGSIGSIWDAMLKGTRKP